MPTLDTIPEGLNPVHLLLIGDTKVGKSTMAAQAALDGFYLVFIDSDNGLSAMTNLFKSSPQGQEAMKRVNYLPTNQPDRFIKSFFRSNPAYPLVWLPEVQKEKIKSLPQEDKVNGIMNWTDDSPVWIMAASELPPSAVIVKDSWTSLSQDQLKQLRADQSQPLVTQTTDSGGSAKQQVYGESRSSNDFVANMFQQLKQHCIVIAHGTTYDIYQKPVGVANPQQKDFTLVDSVMIPMATSNPGGLALGKRFNHIGWLKLHLNQVWIDFRRDPKRIGGGPPNREDKITNLSFKQLVIEANGAMPSPTDDYDSWFMQTTVKDLDASLEQFKARFKKSA